MADNEKKIIIDYLREQADKVWKQMGELRAEYKKISDDIGNVHLRGNIEENFIKTRRVWVFLEDRINELKGDTYESDK